MDNLHWLCSVPIGSTISALGILGNLVAMLVWRRLVNRSSRNSSTGIYLISLAIVDTGFLVMFLSVDALPSGQPQLKQVYEYAVFYSFFGYPLFYVFIVFSIWLILTITVNRFAMVTFPTKVARWYSRRNTKITIAVVGVSALLVNIPHFFSYHPRQNVSMGSYSVALTEFGKSSTGHAYEFWLHCIFLVLVPWFAVASLNGFIIYKLLVQARKFDSKKDMDKTLAERRDRQMTVTLLLVTFSFLILLAWQCITQCFWMLGYGRDHHDASTWKMIDGSFAFAKLGLVINSSVNCLLYCLSGSAFRKELLSLFRSKGSSTRKSQISSLRPARSSTEVLLSDSAV